MQEDIQLTPGMEHMAVALVLGAEHVVTPLTMGAHAVLSALLPLPGEAFPQLIKPGVARQIEC